MHPFFNILGRTIPAYGLMGLCGFLLSIIFIACRCKKLSLVTDTSIYIFVLSFVGALIGAKLLYLLTVLPQFIEDLPLFIKSPSAFISKYISGGMVFYGGLIGGILSAVYWAKSFKVSLSDFIPVLLPALAIISGFGRLGCFMAGCCYGIESSLPIAVVFPVGSIAPSGIPLLPVQLFEAAFDLLLFIVMLFATINPKWKDKSLGLYIILYAVMRFCLEFMRGDSIRGIFLGLSTSQWISITAVILALTSFYFKSGFRQREKDI